MKARLRHWVSGVGLEPSCGTSRCNWRRRAQPSLPSTYYLPNRIGHLLKQIKAIAGLQAELLAAASAGQPSNDQAFADALKTTPSVLAMSLGEGPHSEFVPKAGFAIAGQDPRPFITAFSGASINLPALDAAASGIGAFNWMPDRDQIVRRVALIFRMNESLVPSLAAEALRVAQGASTYVLKASNASGETAFGQSTGLNHIRIGNVEVPTDESGAVYLHFRHFDGSRYIPAWKVLAGRCPGRN